MVRFDGMCIKVTTVRIKETYQRYVPMVHINGTCQRAQDAGQVKRGPLFRPTAARPPSPPVAGGPHRTQLALSWGESLHGAGSKLHGEPDQSTGRARARASAHCAESTSEGDGRLRTVEQ